MTSTSWPRRISSLIPNSASSKGIAQRTQPCRSGVLALLEADSSTQRPRRVSLEENGPPARRPQRRRAGCGSQQPELYWGNSPTLGTIGCTKVVGARKLIQWCLAWKVLVAQPSKSPPRLDSILTWTGGEAEPATWDTCMKLLCRPPRSTRRFSAVRVATPLFKVTVVGPRPWDRAILEVFYSTGIRREELLHLILEDVDLEGGVLRVNLGKGAKDRVVPFGDMTKVFLRGYLTQVRPQLVREWKGVKAVFVSKYGEPMTKTVVGKVVKDSGRKAGLGVEISPHVLRHTCATHMIRRGASMEAVKSPHPNPPSGLNP